MKIQIVFLGTAAVVPTKSRNHNAILLNYKDEKILVDCGEGIQRQIRKAEINPCKLTRILITHWHGDHVLGLPGLFQTLALNNYQKTLYIYGPRGTKKFIKEIFKIFILVGKLKIEVKEVNGKFFENEDFEISALALQHGAPANGYIFQEKDKLRINKNKIEKLKIPPLELKKISEGKNIKINGKIIKAKNFTYKQKGKKISFIFDTQFCNNAKKLADGSDLAIIESTYLKESEEGKLAKEYKHLTAEEAAQIAKSQKVKELILTHISQRYEYRNDLILKEAKKIFKNTKIAEDFMKVEI